MTGLDCNVHGEYARAKALISGRVQGVGFRSFAYRYANAFELTGWVKNLHDGRVEVVVEGDKNKVSQYVRLLETGSPWSRVDNICIQWQPYTGDLSSFRVQ